MKVKELINQLQREDPDREIVGAHIRFEDGYHETILVTRSEVKLLKKIKSDTIIKGDKDV